jgi:uracil-DNA glycosylase
MQFDLFSSPIRFATFDDLITAMHALSDDPLAAFGTRMVIFRGSPEARLMIIGEAPGAEEDAQGLPFVGPSGKLLDQILRAVGFDTERDILVTNAAFRRPPENRKPTADEIDYYKPYLLEIIRLVDPAILVLAGAAAVESLLGDKRGITRIRGQWFEWSGRWAMPVFHPAYLLRNPSREPGSPKALVWRDVQEIRRRYLEVTGAVP